MFAEKSWGSFRILDIEKESLTIKVTLNPGHQMNYHSHDFRNEVWNVISGTGRAVIDGVIYNVHAGDTLQMNAGSKHTILLIRNCRSLKSNSEKTSMYTININTICRPFSKL